MTHLRRLWSRLRARPQAPAAPPMVKVPMLLPALISEPATPMAVTKVAITAVSLETMVCKTARLEQEGAILRLELQWPGMDPVELNVEVEWVDLSSFGHSLGLSVLHQRDSRKQLQRLLQALQGKLQDSVAH